MHVEHHPLIADFPQLREQLHALRQNDSHFARLASEYEALDKQICRAENQIERLGDAALAGLKQQRVALKDDLLQRLTPKTTCCGGCGG